MQIFHYNTCLFFICISYIKWDKHQLFVPDNSNNDKNQVDVVYTQAFDMLDHIILLIKLQRKEAPYIVV
jgi:hypothetical protein